ncbi:hypothetical protein Ae201684P_019779 [Aphanomyces euteiches]|nr:hypothetical protein Ae201684P_019779 [Aphanomyces euteiches]
MPTTTLAQAHSVSLKPKALTRDLHSYAGLVLYPYGDTQQPIGNGDDAKFQKLGKNIQAQMGSSYIAETSATLYVAYGCFDDYHYRKFCKPVLTIEMAGTDFVTPASGIVSHGGEIYRAINQFAKEVVTFNGGSGPTPSTTKATPSPSSKPTPAPSTTSAPKTTKPTTPAPVSGCGTCTYCYYPDGDEFRAMVQFGVAIKDDPRIYVVIVLIVHSCLRVALLRLLSPKESAFSYHTCKY